MARRFDIVVMASVLLAALAAIAAPDHAAAAVAQPCYTMTLDKDDRLQFTELDEASGLVASRRMPDVYWTHNDGDPTASDDENNRLYAINGAGELLATVQIDLHGADPTVPDPTFYELEDIAIGPGPERNVDYLYLADIGDNNVSRDDVAVYRFEEPSFTPNPAAPIVIDVDEAELESTRFSYQRFNDPTRTHSRNAEAIFVDPVNGDLFIIEKGRHTAIELGLPNDNEGKVWANVYRIIRPKLFADGNPVQMAKIVSHTRAFYDVVNFGITGADISQDGRIVVLKNEEETFYWFRGVNQSVPTMFDQNHVAPCFAPDGIKGEAITVLPDGSAFYGVREGSTQPLSPVFKAEIVGHAGIECNGETATIVGTNGDDVITGTTGKDVIVALAGDDVINGLSGNDVICAGSGDDRVDGGGGTDLIIGLEGKDRLIGGSGADKIFGGLHKDTIKGQGGADKLYGGDHGDTVLGGGAADLVRGDKGNDLVDGAGDDDQVIGNGGDDTLNGGGGLDSCDGGSGSDSDAGGCESQTNIP